MNIFEISTAGSMLTIRNTVTETVRTLSLAADIQKTLMIPDSSYIVALLKVPPDIQGLANLLFIDANSGAPVWSKVAATDRSVSNVYCDFKLGDKLDDVIVWDWDGYRTVFDAKTGTIKDSRLVK
jgi:hypothetical protein